MQILLSDLVSEEGKVKEYTGSVDFSVWKSGMGEYPIKEAGPVRLIIANTGKKNLEISVACDLTLLSHCDRCLEEVEVKLHIQDTEQVDMGLTEGQRLSQLDEKTFINGLTLDVDRLIQTELYAYMPMKVLCRQDCKGICNRCGANLNYESCTCSAGPADPRMAAILDIFKAARKEE